MDIMDIAIAKALAGGGGGGGGSAVTFVNAEVSYDQGTGLFVVDSLDKTFEQLTTAFSNGELIVANATIAALGDGYIQLSLSSINDEVLTFIAVDAGVESTMEISSLFAYRLDIQANGGHTFKYGEKMFSA